jgi:peptidyl-tRNA hydrolase, PTH1 family
LFAIVGLGNPGTKYELTRHNVGFWVIEKLANQCNVSNEAIDWKQKFNCFFAYLEVFGAKSILVLPQKYMNNSGQAILPLCQFYKIGVQEIIVVHDEVDLEPGVVRLKLDGGSGGHRGLEDIQNAFGSSNFYRVRLGIGHPRMFNLNEDVSSWVLKKLDAEGKDILDEAVNKAILGIKILLTDGLEAAQREIHKPANDE